MSHPLHFLNGFGAGNGSLSALSVTGAPKQDDPSDEQGNKVRWAALLILLVIIPTIGGNILVILAVSLEKKLQYATNYFLTSLAVADLLVGLFVMPIALLIILFDVWMHHGKLPVYEAVTSSAVTRSMSLALSSEANLFTF